MDHIDLPGEVLAEIDELKRSRDDALHAARSAVRDASRVNRLLTVLNEPAPTESLLDNILNTISEVFSADVVTLSDVAGTGHFYPVASVGMPEDFVFEKAWLADISPLYDPLREGGILTRETIRAIPVLDELAKQLRLESIVWIPMKGNRELRGALSLARCAPLAFTREEIDLLSTMAYRIAVTLEQIQHRSQLEHIIRGNREIVGRQMQESAIEEEAARTFPLIVGGDAAIIFRCAGDCCILCAGGAERINAKAPEWPLLARQLSQHPAIQAGESVSITDSTRSRFPANCPDFPFAAMLVSPIFREGRLENLICALRTNAVDFTEGTRQVATLYSGHLASALENAHLYGALHSELQERKLIEAFLRESEERFRALVHNISDVIAVLDSKGVIKYVGEAARPLWGRAPEEFIGLRLLDRVHPEDMGTVAALIEGALEKPRKSSRVVARMRDGETDAWRFFDLILSNLLHDKAVNGIVATFHDVTERKIYEKELSELAFRDPLTGLANRANFCDRLRFALARADERNTSVVVVFFDLDNFKYVNDTFGHAAGDTVLRTTAERVLGCLRSNDTAARLGGDEFTILIEHIKVIEHSLPVVERLLAALMEPVRIEGIDVSVGGSIGVAISMPNEDDVESLLQKADLAMYRAKRSGKGRYVFFDSAFSGQA